MEAFAALLPLLCFIVFVVILFCLSRRGGIFASAEQTEYLDEVDKDLKKKGL